MVHSFFRRKLNNKLKETEEALATAEQKYSSTEKTKVRMAAELEDLNLDLEKVSSNRIIYTYLVSSWSFPPCYNLS